ncbi:PepSY-associated TM helix domain-containing protein [Bordetella petrii]|uniref:PepSY-associated TM helix domain-containing protein n=1 Tax=Bordetella petrii TaxID=94624 RepID=UPI001E383386|nr:PepSY domain-containing protein [Bordetella petrii]MCD0503949.1 PepSY domain-containing protein [Bordetella petrii]
MAKPSRSKLWFLVHSWLALPIWIFLFFVCATGTIAVISQEIVWLINPAVRAQAPSDDAQRLGYQALVDAIKRQEPNASVQRLSWPEESQFALTASVSYPGAKNTSIYVNPYTGAVQGPALEFDLRQFMRALHGWLLIPFTNGFSWGWYLVSFLGIPMLASLVTGLVVYKRFWRAYFQKPRLRTGQGGRIFWGDFHRLAGLWSVWFVLLISVSAIWFLVQAILFDTHTTISTEGVPAIVARDQVPTVAPGETVQRLPLDEVVAVAQRELPGLEAQHIFFPGNAYDPVTIMGRGAYPLMFQHAHVNPYNGNVEDIRSLSDRSNLEFFTESMRPLHTGDFGGFWLKVVWFLFGLLLTMMSLSGMLIWTKRTAKETAKALRPARARRPAVDPREVTE